MKRNIISACLAALLCASAASAAIADQARVSNLKVDRSTDRLLVDMTIDADDLGRKTNRESWLTPVLTTPQGDTLRLPSIMVGGRNRYFQAQRRHETAPLYRGGRIDYKANVPYASWMESADLSLERRDAGCCGAEQLLTTVPLRQLDFRPRVFTPNFNYIAPAAEAVKARELSGRAFVDFPVNKTVIYPDYRSNTRELAKIRAGIDSVRQDKDITVRGITLKGFASPEGPWNNNVRLAKGRTESLKKYVEGLYDFPSSIYSTAYEPEDWEGLVAWLRANSIADREGLLAIATDTSLAPDARDARLKSQYPAAYARLLREVYPALRHTDYTIAYTIRSYNDPQEILKLVYSKPQNLSLNEFFVAAQNVERGSKEYDYIFETAARMYPDSEIANLNAANAAMAQGAYDNAARYLAKAGEGSEAVYARGILAALQGDYAAARPLFEQAARLRVADAPAAISQIEEIEAFNAGLSTSPENK